VFALRCDENYDSQTIDFGGEFVGVLASAYCYLPIVLGVDSRTVLSLKFTLNPFPWAPHVYQLALRIHI
jgi:hypothetical protein